MTRRRAGRLGVIRRDGGSATIWLLGIGLAIITLLAGVAAAGAAAVARHRAQAAADLGALAGAVQAGSGTGQACVRAAEIVAANSARPVSCVVDGLDVTVTASVVAPLGLGTARATARAGPVR